MDIRAGLKAITSGWSVGKAFSIAPGDRLFFYRSKVEPCGIFAVGTALPADIPEAREWRGIVPVPVKPGLAVYEAPHWRYPDKTAFYINAEWHMMADPMEGRVLIPFERLRDEKPFSRIFATKGANAPVRGAAPQASGSHIANPEIVDALYAECEKAFPVVLREYDDTELHKAASRNDADEVRSLLKSGADLEARNIHGLVPLDMAAGANSAGAIAVLVEGGANVNGRGENGETPMHWAAGENACEAIEELAKLGADCNAKDGDGLTPTHAAAMGNAREAIVKLAALGANVNARDNAGGTPMHFAADRGAYEAIEELVKLGADINARDNDGHAPLDDAEESKMEESAALLRKLGGKRGAEL